MVYSPMSNFRLMFGQKPEAQWRFNLIDPVALLAHVARGQKECLRRLDKAGVAFFRGVPLVHVWGQSMSRGLIEIGRLDVQLTSHPIKPSWIIAGKPEASVYTLRSAPFHHRLALHRGQVQIFDATILIPETATRPSSRMAVQMACPGSP